MKYLPIIFVSLFLKLSYCQGYQKKVELYEGLINKLELTSKTNYVCINDFYYDLKRMGTSGIIFFPDSLRYDDLFRKNLIEKVGSNSLDSLYFSDLNNSYFIGAEARNYNVLNLGADYTFYYVYPPIESEELHNYMDDEKLCDFMSIIAVYYFNRTNSKITSRTIYYQVTRKIKDKEFKYKQLNACSTCSEY